MQAAMPSVAQNFSKMDTNADGQVSRDEMRNYKMQHGHADMQKSFTAADVNGDKMIDKSEAVSLSMLNENFAAIDTNKDGSVSMGELNSYHQARHDKWSQGGKSSAEADQTRSTTTESTSTTTTTDQDSATSSKDAGDSSTTTPNQ